jgi:7-keto-8-aminopelargonate synthetase-like enzyme
MDMLMHNSSDVAAQYATEHVFKFKHNDLEDLEKKLKFWRDRTYAERPIRRDRDALLDELRWSGHGRHL